ncbi:MAG: methionyl-tRNA formyltransferase [Rikenellaceae bacterium]
MANAKELRIVFMGTPEFSVPSLRGVVEAGYNVVGVVTTPDRAAGRGQKLYECDVKREALRLGLPILQPQSLKDEGFLKALRAWEPDLGIVIAFRMLPEVVWAMSKHGTFNLHASLLPDYRGAAPINHAIINGDKKSGVTTFLLNHKIDQGAIIAQREVEILKEDNVGTLYERLMNIGVDEVIRTIELIASGEYTPITQEHIDESTLRPAPKIFKENCLIDWSWSGTRIVNFVRGLSPYPAAWCNLTPLDQTLPATTAKVFDVRFDPSKRDLAVGEVESDERTYIGIGCADGTIYIESIQLSGKKRLSTQELLRGFRSISNYKVEK